MRTFSLWWRQRRVLACRFSAVALLAQHRKADSGSPFVEHRKSGRVMPHQARELAHRDAEDSRRAGNIPSTRHQEVERFREKGRVVSVLWVDGEARAFPTRYPECTRLVIVAMHSCAHLEREPEAQPTDRNRTVHASFASVRRPLIGAPWEGGQIHCPVAFRLRCWPPGPRTDPSRSSHTFRRSSLSRVAGCGAFTRTASGSMYWLGDIMPGSSWRRAPTSSHRVRLLGA